MNPFTVDLEGITPSREQRTADKGNCVVLTPEVDWPGGAVSCWLLPAVCPCAIHSHSGRRLIRRRDQVEKLADDDIRTKNLQIFYTCACIL